MDGFEWIIALVKRVYFRQWDENRHGVGRALSCDYFVFMTFWCIGYLTLLVPDRTMWLVHDFVCYLVGLRNSWPVEEFPARLNFTGLSLTFEPWTFWGMSSLLLSVCVSRFKELLCSLQSTHNVVFFDMFDGQSFVFHESYDCQS
jgi:hypothetical protein